MVARHLAAHAVIVAIWYKTEQYPCPGWVPLHRSHVVWALRREAISQLIQLASALSCHCHLNSEPKRPKSHLAWWSESWLSLVPCL